MEINMDFLKRFLNNIAVLFGERCEIVLHDFTGSYDNTIVHIVNGQISGRKIGDCPSSFFFEHLVNGEIQMDDKPVYFNTTQKGKMLKSSTTFLKDKNGKIVGSVCINFDVTAFFSAQCMLENFLNYSEQKNEMPQENEILVNNVNELLEYYLTQCEKEIGKPASVMQKEEKMRALEYLDKKGALQISKAGIRLCQFFQISKFTLYHYLDEIREKQKGETTQ